MKISHISMDYSCYEMLLLTDLILCRYWLLPAHIKCCIHEFNCLVHISDSPGASSHHGSYWTQGKALSCKAMWETGLTSRRFHECFQPLRIFLQFMFKVVPGASSTQDAYIISELAIKGFSLFPCNRIYHNLFDLAHPAVQYIRAFYQKHTVNVLLNRFYKYSPLTCALSEIWDCIFLFVQVTKEPKAYQGFLEKREKQVSCASSSAQWSSLLGLSFQGCFSWSLIKF